MQILRLGLQRLAGDFRDQRLSDEDVFDSFGLDFEESALKEFGFL